MFLDFFPCRNRGMEAQMLLCGDVFPSIVLREKRQTGQQRLKVWPAAKNMLRCFFVAVPAGLLLGREAIFFLKSAATFFPGSSAEPFRQPMASERPLGLLPILRREEIQQNFPA